MNDPSFNLLTEPLLEVAPHGLQTLPGVLALLVRDEVESFNALRPHQEAAWHMFLVQLAALALHRTGRSDFPADEIGWCTALRALTPAYSGDEPWSLVVPNPEMPAFLQAPVPKGISMEAEVRTPDALDLLITARNHDLKQNIAAQAQPEDWAYALVSLQTSEGYGGPKNYGIARMNGGSSSRPMLTLAPARCAGSKELRYTPGAWFKRDVAMMLAMRDEALRQNEHLRYRPTGGIALLWLEPWPEQHQLGIGDLDIWFIEICRRIRLIRKNDLLYGRKGNSAKARIAADAFKGALGDPWAPVHKTENKSFTLGENQFTYELLVTLLYSGDWVLPLLAKPGKAESAPPPMMLVAQALARGNCKTWGYRTRCLPVGGKVQRSLLLQDERESVHKIANQLIGAIKNVDGLLRDALALYVSQGDPKAKLKNRYKCAEEARAHFDRAVDAIFFEHLWARYESQEQGDDAAMEAQSGFFRALRACAEPVFEQALQALPCASLFRARAEARARSRFFGRLKAEFPAAFQKTENQEESNAAE